ncbi:MAG: Gfo/Idh/MocA family protein [Thermoguttaceae bacterium]|jgi:predicted dehydrogenase
MKKIKYALIGFGGIAENRIAKEGFACDKHRFTSRPDEYELIGVTDVNPARKAAADALGLHWYTDNDAILTDPQIDAVYIATNNVTHVPLATAALNAGKHALLEKPLAPNVADAEAISKLAVAKGLSLGVDHMMVNNKLNRYARDVVAAGKLGVVNDSCFHMEFAYGFTPEEAATWRCANASELGGPVGDVASHCFYLAEYIFGKKIDALAAVYYPKTLGIEVEDGAYIRFKIDGELAGSARVAFSEPRGGLQGTLTNLGFEIYGTDAVLRSYGSMFQLSGYPDEPIPLRIELDHFTSQEKITLDSEPTPNIYQEMIRQHALSIIEGKPLDGSDGLRNVKLCLAAHQSAQSGGAWIEIN